MLNKRVFDSKILDGKKAANNICLQIKTKIKKENIRAKLAVILVGDDPASCLYTQIKRKKCFDIGIDFELVKFNNSCNEQSVISTINDLNNDKKTSGIIIQLPLSEHINTSKIINSVQPKKDVDGLTNTCINKLATGNPIFECCTPKGILKLLSEYQISLENKNTVLLGCGQLVGKPLAMMLRNRKLKFFSCNKSTKNILNFARNANILISATGVPHLVKSDYIKPGAIVIDAGISKLENKIVGDVDFDSVINIASKITPVPGGVGPMTVAMLMENVIKAYQMQNDLWHSILNPQQI
jgi:methylenetetrahydrofolate dehydrogenase (NADP+) / methenyltetrahydrofolate cyclohydrolase